MAKTNVVEVPKVKMPKEEKEVVEGQEAMKAATDSTEIFQLMESRDEDQMMQEIMGIYSKEYVYDIPYKGGEVSKCDTPNCSLAKKSVKHTHVRGLSWSGIKEARRIFKGIDTSDLTKPVLVEENGRKFYECGVITVDLRTGNSTRAFKRQPLLKQRRDGSYLEDPFAYEIVQSKAKRNAISEILPQPLIRAWIGDYLKGKKDFDPKRVVEMGRGDYKVMDSEPKAKASPKKAESKKELTEQEKTPERPVLVGSQANNILKKGKVEKIKAALLESGWNPDDPKVISNILGNWGINSVAALEKAEDSILDSILKMWKK